MFQMINKIIDGISVAINSEFGDNYEIYTESVEQGLKEPCFSIVALPFTNEQFLGKRYFHTSNCCIHYFPSSDESRNESFIVMARLFDALEYITVDGDLTRGTGMKAEFVDGVLDFFINYDMFVCKPGEVEPGMEEVVHKPGLKG